MSNIIFTIPANSVISKSFPARYMFVESVSIKGAEFTITSNDEDVPFEYVMSKGAKLSNFPKTLNSYLFENKTALDLKIELLAGQVLFDKNNIEGDINALTRSDNLTSDDNQFIAGYTVAGTAANTAYMGLLNPANSGVNLNLSGIKVTAGSGQYSVNSLKSSDGGLVNVTNLFLMNHNKLLGGNASKGQLYALSLAATPAGSNVLYTASSNINLSPNDTRFGESPIMIPPDWILFVKESVLNTKLISTFEWYEESV
ncbi:MAG: hypothetical protein QM500_04150 [Methylococcales bacterium]